MKSICRYCHRRISKRLKRAHEASCVADRGNKSFVHYTQTRSSQEQQKKAAKRRAAKRAR